MAPLTAISLFSGAGGLDLGFEWAGVQTVWAGEADSSAIATYEANFSLLVSRGEIPSNAPPPELDADIVFGGPPCQGFSSFGKRDPSDPRSALIFEPLEIAARNGARAVVIENVAVVATLSRWEQLRQQIQERAAELGFFGRFYVLNAADFGVPQVRKRMFFIAFADQDRHLSMDRWCRNRVTVRQAFGALPRYKRPGNATVCPARVVPAPRPVLRRNPYGGGLMFNGSGRVLDLDAPARTLTASMGGNATPIIDQAELVSGSRPWIVGYHRHLLKGGPPRLVTPSRMRRLTVEEAAALQSFPPGFRFEGARNSRFRQIGNAVPPLLGYAVAAAVSEELGVAPQAIPVSGRRSSPRGRGVATP